MLLLASCTTPSGTGKREADFTHYDEPLYEQMTGRIKAKVTARLGEGTNAHDRYFIIPYAYQNKRNDPAFSHSFICVSRVYADETAPEPTSRFKHVEYKGRDFEVFTISWLPADFAEKWDNALHVALEREVRPVEGIPELLRSLRIPYCVASNGEPLHMEKGLTAAGLMPFVKGRLFSAALVAHPKPAPDVYLHAAQTMGANPSRCAVVEDTPTGDSIDSRPVTGG